MKKLILLFAATLLLTALPACSDKQDKSDQPNTAHTTKNMVTKDMVSIDMVATHAINTEVSVAQLVFVPNSTAPWLGRIILLDDSGHLYSTDIEGRSPKSVGSGTYIDIFGLARDKAAGVFLAITEDNKIEAFIESDDYGNFSPMIYSGENIDAAGFCYSKTPTDNTMRVITTKDQVSSVNLLVKDSVVEQIILEPKGGTSSCFEGTDHPNTVFLDTKHSTGFGLSPNKVSGLTIVSLDRPTITFRASIKNGLSVAGVEHIKYITSTQSNYGAGGYNTGVLALVDADADTGSGRIVFISLSYAERQLLNVISPPQDAP